MVCKVRDMQQLNCQIVCHVFLQKLEGLVAVLAPEQTPQKDVSTLEDMLVTACSTAMSDQSPLGKLIVGPPESSSLASVDKGSSESKHWSFPSRPVMWDAKQLAKLELQVSGGTLAVSCKRVRRCLLWKQTCYIVTS